MSLDLSHLLDKQTAGAFLCSLRDGGVQSPALTLHTAHLHTHTEQNSSIFFFSIHLSGFSKNFNAIQRRLCDISVVLGSLLVTLFENPIKSNFNFSPCSRRCCKTFVKKTNTFGLCHPENVHVFLMLRSFSFLLACFFNILSSPQCFFFCSFL